MNTRRIFICGFMGSGKTTVGAFVAQRMNFPFFDTDHIIEKKTGRTVSDLFADFGETYFRDAETVCLKETIQNYHQGIFALGGGALLRRENQVLVKNSGALIHLAVSHAEIIRRIGRDGNRPLWDADRLDRLMEAREEGYRTADRSFDTDGFTAQSVADAVVRYIMNPPGIEKK